MTKTMQVLQPILLKIKKHGDDEMMFKMLYRHIQVKNL